jgi:hypothetical protein
MTAGDLLLTVVATSRSMIIAIEVLEKDYDPDSGSGLLRACNRS